MPATTTNTSDRVDHSYDAMNHVVSGSHTSVTVLGGFVESAQYEWGVDGHPVLIGDAQVPVPSQRTGATPPPPPPITSFDTLHWDGDQLLFTTNSAGAVDEVPVGTRGAILPLDSGYAGLTWFDRTTSGSVVGCRNATGSTNAAPTTPSLTVGDSVSCTILPTPNAKMPVFETYGTPLRVGNGAVLTMPRADGITDGVSIIQGVRAYDPTMGVWTTPDAYAGDVSDPMTQKPFMWNGNDPASYSDPSGFAPLFRDSSSEGDRAESPHDVALEGQYLPKNHYTSADIRNLVLGAFAQVVMFLHRNIDPHDYSDLQNFANAVNAAFTEVGPDFRSDWSITLNFVTATLQGRDSQSKLAFTAVVGVGESSLLTSSHGIENLSSDEFMRYAHNPGSDEMVEDRLPAGWNKWEPIDFVPSPDDAWEVRP